jgi:hypothetical protein
MPAMTLPPDPDLSLSALSPADWLAALDAIGDRLGSFHRLGPSHHALFVDAGRTLLVTFETQEAARRNPGAVPRGLGFATRDGWSLMAFLSDGETWFRDPALWGTFDRLIQDGFFEDFDRVLFLGEGAAGYAACAYSVAAPGARVLAWRPQATLDPSVAGWDSRYPAARQRDFTTRYGFAPDMLEGAARAHLLYDPMLGADARHAALYQRPNVTLLPCPHAGSAIGDLLDQMQITRPLVEAAMAGRLDRTTFARLWRARRDCPDYLRKLQSSAEEAGRPALAAAVAAAVAYRNTRAVRDARRTTHAALRHAPAAAGAGRHSTPAE